MYGIRHALSYEQDEDYLLNNGYEEIQQSEPNDIENLAVETGAWLIKHLMEYCSADRKSETLAIEVQDDEEQGPIVYNRQAIVSKYTEREAIQTEVLNALCMQPDTKMAHTISFNMVNLHGVGGNGKSQLAKKMFTLSQYHQLFDGNLIWFNAEKDDGPAGLYSQHEALINSRGHPTPGSIDEIKSTLYNSILGQQDSLIVLDNVTDFEVVLKYLPTNDLNKGTRVILTSKKPLDPGERGEIVNIPVGVFSENEARNYVKEFSTNINEAVTEEQLVEIFNKTSRIPADLSLICHSFQYMKKECDSSYSWTEHLTKYGDILSTHENPLAILPEVEGLDYSENTTRNVACSMRLLASVTKHNVGPFSVFMLKNMAFCDGKEISRREFAHRHPEFLRWAEKCTLEGSAEVKITYGLSFLRRFGFTKELQRGQDVIMSVHQSYQCAIIREIMQPSEIKVSKKGIKPKSKSGQKEGIEESHEDQVPGKEKILLGLIQWLQLKEVGASLLLQKLQHAIFVWRHLEKNPVLLQASTRTRDMLIALCIHGDYESTQTWEHHCQDPVDFIAMLLDDEGEDKSPFYGSALQRTVYNEDHLALQELVIKVKTRLRQLQDRKKRNRLQPLKKLFSHSRKATHNPKTLTEDYIHSKVLKIAYNSIKLSPALEIIITNFSLRYYEPVPSEEGRTLLHASVMRKCSAEKVQAIISLPDRYYDPDVDALTRNREYVDMQDSDGMTALHFAAMRGLPDIVQVLLEAGANAGLQDSYGKTALHFAAMRGLPDIVQVLLQAGANAGLQDFDGNTSLHYAIIAPRLDVEKVGVQVAEERGVEIQTIAKLHRLRRAYPQISIATGSGESGSLIEAALIEYEAKMNTAMTKYSRIVELILRRGNSLNLDTENNSGVTALHLAIHPSTLIMVDTIASLLQAGAGVNYPLMPVGFTALHYAMIRVPPNLDIVRLLLRHGALPSSTDKDGNTPADWLETWRSSDDFIEAAENDYQEILNLLKAKGD